MTIGGKELVIGSWGEYEINKRNVRNDPYRKYYIASYIYPDDVVYSVLSSIDKLPLHSILKKFNNDVVIDNEFKYM